MAISKKQVEAYNKSVYSLYENLQNDLINEICGHFRADVPPSTMDEWRFQRLAEMGGFTTKAASLIAKRTGQSVPEVAKAFKAAGITTLQGDEVKYKRARQDGYFKTAPLPAQSTPAFQRIVKNATAKATDYLNAVHTTALQASKTAFTDITNKTFLQVTSGQKTYSQAVATAVRELADKGITGATYISKAGRTTRVNMDVAVRRMVVTSNSQLAGDLQINRAQEWGSNFVETSSHMGARPSHAVWQGRVFQLVGNDKYPNFAENTHYGQGDGIKGYNCQHDFYPFFPGLSEPAFDHPNVKENNAQYEAEQTQRKLESNIRQQKRRAVAAKAAGDTEGETAARVKLGQLQKQLREHVAKNDLYRDPSREQIGQKVTAINPPSGPATEPKPAPKKTPVQPPKAKPTTTEPDTRAIGEAFAGLPAAEAEAVSLIKNAPEAARAAWNTLAPVLKYDTLTSNAGAWYDPKTRALTLNIKKIASGEAVHPKFATYYHESGHALDHLTGSGGVVGNYDYISMTYKGGAFGKALRADVDNVIAHQPGKNITEQRAEVTRWLSEGDMHDYGDISDIFQQATKGKVHGLVGHFQKVLVQRYPTRRYKNYWDLHGSLEHEAFAEMYSSVVANPGSLDNIKTFFPNAYQVFTEILNDIAAKGVAP
ncbi:MAG: hypothetical protein PHU51_06245 [Candidatus Nanoarchaeia archaeon]|nr:hypothetical protein [Candidatus Nanoarchaeia archaeon]